MIGLMAAATLGLAATAQAGTLYSGYNGGFALGGGVIALDSPSLAAAGMSIDLPSITGLAEGGGSLFVGHGSTLARYDLNGNLITSLDFGPLTVGALAYGSGELMAVLQAPSGWGLWLLNPSNLGPFGLIDTSIVPITGVAYGGGRFYAAHDRQIDEYDTNGAFLSFVDTGAYLMGGALAYGGGDVYAGYTTVTDLSGVVAYNPLTLDPVGDVIATDDLVNGLAVGDGQLFMSFDHSLARYDLATKVTGGYDTGPFYANGPLAFREELHRFPDGGVPEPASWALMLVGFGAIGTAARMRRPTRTAPG